jgi:hypothetical protein
MKLPAQTIAPNTTAIASANMATGKICELLGSFRNIKLRVFLVPSLYEIENEAQSFFAFGFKNGGHG